MQIPKYNQVQNIVRSFLFSPKNSITIYTEDKESDKIFYKLLFSRLDLKNIKINDVIQLGPKSDVIEKSIEVKSSKFPSLFIVDGDLKLMAGQKLETKNLISHNRYCIENFLCCEEGIVNYLYVKLGEDKEILRKKLDFERFLMNNCKMILELYYRYSISFELGCGISFKKVDDFYNTGRVTKVDNNKIEAEILSIEKVIKLKIKSNGCRAYGKEFNRKLNVLKTSNPPNIETLLSIVSGKDHLLPLLIKLKINELDRTSVSLHKDQIKRLLAEKIDLKPFDKIRDKIFHIVNN